MPGSVAWPSDWRFLPLWSLFRRVKDVGHPDEEMLSVYREHGVVVKDSRADNFNKTAPDRNIYQLVDEGWLIVNRMKAWQGSLGISPHRGIVSGHYICFEPQHNEHPQFLNYLLRSKVYTAELRRMSRGVRPNQIEIDNEALRTLRVCLPAVAEQRAIADYLDTETARIDALIAKKGEFARLVEQRFRDRVRQLMGELFDQHGSVPLKRLVQCLDGRRVPVSLTERARRTGPYPYYGASGVVDTIDGYLFDEELVLLGEDGAQLLDPEYRVAFVVRGKCWVNNHAHVLRPQLADAQFLTLHLATIDRAPFLSGATRPKLTQDDMGRIPVPRCDLRIQRETALRLSHEEARIGELTDRLDRQIELLREHRQALITAAVTGELEVPGVAA